MKRTIKYTVDVICESHVEGWAVGPSGRCGVEVIMDGRAVGQAVTGIERLDVGAALPGLAGSGESGFLYAFSERDFPKAGTDAQVSLRITSDGLSLETDPVAIPISRAGGALPPALRSPLPPAATSAIIARSPNLATGDLTTDDGARAAVDVLEYLVRRGPRPLFGVHRYLGYLRTVYGAALYAAQHFSRANRRATGEKDRASMLTGPKELAAIAHHLYVLAEVGVPGALLEFGCYKGFSTSVLSTACHILGRPMDVFDSFAGLPPSDSAYYRAGEFAGGLAEVARNVAEFGRPDVVSFHEGFFSASVAQWVPRPAACLWMDVDLEQSAVDALKAFPALDRRGALFSHECRPAHFDGRLPVPRRGPDDVVGPIVDAFSTAGRRAVGFFLTANTGAFWDADDGVPVLPMGSFERVLSLALA